MGPFLSHLLYIPPMYILNTLYKALCKPHQQPSGHVAKLGDHILQFVWDLE